MELLLLKEECNNEKPEEEVLKRAKRHEVVGASDTEDAFSDGVNDDQKKRSNEAGEVYNEEVEDEMDVLEAMVARRKTMVEPLATSGQEVNNADEVAMEHETLKNTNKNGGDKKPRRRRAKSTRTNERDGSNKKESKPDCNAEKGYNDRGTD